MKKSSLFENFIVSLWLFLFIIAVGMMFGEAFCFLTRVC